MPGVIQFVKSDHGAVDGGFDLELAIEIVMITRYTLCAALVKAFEQKPWGRRILRRVTPKFSFDLLCQGFRRDFTPLNVLCPFAEPFFLAVAKAVASRCSLHALQSGFAALFTPNPGMAQRRRRVVGVLSCKLAVGCWLLAVGCWLLNWFEVGRSMFKDLSFSPSAPPQNLSVSIRAVRGSSPKTLTTTQDQ
ncbi:MAG: hypothetical protein JJU29_22280 [Verrucomicrobia bacterium]|nr:hypothetical protein [Verrucomicrobiota bacterium]MCH8514136.1 hypothetical protein [Kiritimatiellia bacterium]